MHSSVELCPSTSSPVRASATVMDPKQSRAHSEGFPLGGFGVVGGKKRSTRRGIIAPASVVTTPMTMGVRIFSNMMFSF